jgi:uncharacterized membrane protein
LSLQNCSKRCAGLSCGGGVSFWGVSAGVSGCVGVVVPPSVAGGVVSVVGVVSVCGAGSCLSVCGSLGRRTRGRFLVAAAAGGQESQREQQQRAEARDQRSTAGSRRPQ